MRRRQHKIWKRHKLHGEADSSVLGAYAGTGEEKELLLQSEKKLGKEREEEYSSFQFPKILKKNSLERTTGQSTPQRTPVFYDDQEKKGRGK